MLTALRSNSSAEYMGRAGVSSPSATPAMVAWTPDSRKHSQVPSASGTKKTRERTPARLATAVTPKPSKPPTSQERARSSV